MLMHDKYPIIIENNIISTYYNHSIECFIIIFLTMIITMSIYNFNYEHI